jgi:probable rRNA maturation factor
MLHTTGERAIGSAMKKTKKTLSPRKSESKAPRKKAAGLRCAVSITNDCGRAVPLDPVAIQRVAEAACAEHRVRGCSLTVALVAASRSNTLHRRHFDVAGKTDVMTFPDGAIDPESGRKHLADLAVCPDVARETAPRHGLSERDETTLYILHGLLHALGHDDATRAGAKRMWTMQRKLMRLIGVDIGLSP